MKFPHLLSAGHIGGLELRNRILMSPMGSNLAEADGHCGERIQSYYEARARGGAGALIVEVASIAWPSGASNPNQIAISRDEFLPGLRALAERIKRHGCRAAIQLQHAGKVAVCDIAAGRPMLVPSLPTNGKDEMMFALTPEEMNAFVKSYSAKGARTEYRVAGRDDIRQLVERFADAAERARRAGFEAVELHAGHGYIISEFLSPHVNRRDDEYGGCLENRARLLVEVLQAVRRRCGDEFPVWCRIDAREFRVDDGIVYADAVETAAIAERAGAAAIHVSAYANPASGAGFTEAPLVHEPGGYLGFARGIKQRVAIPVIAVGRIEPEVAERVIGNGEADFVAMGRKLLADPELPAKLQAGRIEDIRPCIYCYVCVSQIFFSRQLRCAVNAHAGYETQTLVQAAPSARRVLVIGAGPGGMEAARVAALRGHQVSLYEAGERLGGTALFSAMAYPANGRLVEYLRRQVRELPIEVHLNCALDADVVQRLQPDAVVVAIGARRDAPAIEGAGQRHVFSGDELRQLLAGAAPAVNKLGALARLLVSLARWLGITGRPQLLRKLGRLWLPLGRRVVILGGGLVGVELAEFLAERGRRVTVVEEGEKFGVELSVVRRWRILEELDQLGVVMISQARVLHIGRRTVALRLPTGEREIDADTVIVASGARSNLDLVDELKQDFETHVIGDCAGVGYIEGAMHSGNRVGRSL